MGSVLSVCIRRSDFKGLLKRPGRLDLPEMSRHFIKDYTIVDGELNVRTVHCMLVDVPLHFEREIDSCEVSQGRSA